jgi:hypothetical protein
VDAGLAGPNRSLDRFNEAKALWDRENPANYAVTVQRLCFCVTVEPVRIVVQNRVVISRTVVATQLPLPANLNDLYPDIPGLFATIKDAYARADAVTVSFDPRYGFPSDATIDYVKSAIDDELTLKVSDFIPLPIP